MQTDDRRNLTLNGPQRFASGRATEPLMTGNE